MFRQAPSRRDRPAQIDLLRTDAADQRSKEVQLTDLPNPRVKTVQFPDNRILLNETFIVPCRGKVRRSNRGSHQFYVRAIVKANHKRWRIHTTGGDGDEWNPRVS